jgi:hypothetical protein
VRHLLDSPVLFTLAPPFASVIPFAPLPLSY